VACDAGGVELSLFEADGRGNFDLDQGITGCGKLGFSASLGIEFVRKSQIPALAWGLTMLIEFSVGNYRSFKEVVTFSMVAANLRAKDKALDARNSFVVDDKLTLLKSAAIYGANASGKSNLAKALAFMKWFMVNSSRDTQSTDAIGVEPFRLSTETEGQPSHFELVFLMDGRKYRYGFEADRDRIVSEWLFYVPKAREVNLFKRDLDDIKAAKAYDADSIAKRTRLNALFLSVSAQFNVEIAERILKWVMRQLQIVSGLYNETDLRYTIDCLETGENKSDIIWLTKKLDLGIDDIQIREEELKTDLLPSRLAKKIKDMAAKEGGNNLGITETHVSTYHKKFDGNGAHISNETFDLEIHESDGTNKIFALSSLFISMLREGDTLVIDELDARLHPLISLAIVELFNSPESNPKNAQLIFMTHDTNLLSNRLFRRDQIWFTEKNRYGATSLYSLAEYKIRNDASFESDYIKGKYGAIPYIGNLSDLMDSHA
jgi:uncharacterized protein